MGQDLIDAAPRHHVATKKQRDRLGHRLSLPPVPRQPLHKSSPMNSIAPAAATSTATTSSARPNLIEIRDLHFAYNDRRVLNGLTLDVPRGKVVGILGVSGSGKSTLLRLIGGQLRPSAGHVEVGGKIVDRLSTAELYGLRREMGMMFQMSGLFTDLSVFDNIAFPFREHTDLPEPMIRDLVLMKLEAVGLRGARRLMPAELSGGMARRVALARAIALDPLLVMYDEPFAGLDPISLNVIANLIRRLNDALGVTSIVVTYDASESLKVADYVYLLADGVVVGHGTPAELMESSDPYIHQFVHAEADGPVAFRYPAKPYESQLGLRAPAARNIRNTGTTRL
jgi:phospholipid/cholesterol/gamma-HCH transport system ATP-binding protein